MAQPLLSSVLSMYYKDRNFNFFEYEELTKDLCYHKPFTFNFQAHNQRTRFQFSEVAQVKSGKCIFTDSTKIIHKILTNHLIVTNFAPNSMRLYYGYRLSSNQQHPSESNILYSRFKSDRKLQNACFTLGVQRKTSHIQADMNMSIFLLERKNDYVLYSKFMYMARYINFGLLSIFDFGSSNLQTNNLVLEVKPHEKHQIFVRGEVDGLRNYSLKYSKIQNYFDYLIVNYIMKPTASLSLMAELKYDINTNKMKNIESIIEKKFTRNKLKVGLNHFADILLQIQFPLSISSSTCDFGIELSDVLKSRRISYGFKLNLNL